MATQVTKDNFSIPEYWKRKFSEGPTAWSHEYSSCKGKHQSPIDIDMLHVKKVKLPPLNLHNFEKPPNATQIENNGHTGKALEKNLGRC